MLTIPVPVAADRLQIRFEGAVPCPVRLSDEMRALVAEGLVEADDDEQARDRQGVPVWFVRLTFRDRLTGAVATERIRRSSETQPHSDIPSGAYVALAGLTLAHSEFNGRISRRWSYSAMTVADPGHTVYGAKVLNRFALDSSTLTVEALSTLPKAKSHSDDVRAAVRSGAISANAVAKQATDADNRPLWLVEVRLDNGTDIAYENVTVAGDDPKLGGGEAVTIDGLTVSGWSVGDMCGTTLKAAAISKARKGKHQAPVSAPLDAPAPAAV